MSKALRALSDGRPHVCFWQKADTVARLADVRFQRNTGHRTFRVHG